MFAVLLSTRGCCSQEDQCACLFQRDDGCFDDRNARCPAVGRSCEQLCRIPRAACRSASRLQLGVEADSGREQHQPRKVLCSVGVACLSNGRVQEATAEGMMVVARWIDDYRRDESNTVPSYSAMNDIHTYTHRLIMRISHGIPFTSPPTLRDRRVLALASTYRSVHRQLLHLRACCTSTSLAF